MSDRRRPRFIGMLARLLPRRYRQEIVDDLLDDAAAMRQSGRLRPAIAAHIVAHLLRSAMASRCLVSNLPRRPFAGLARDAGYEWRRFCRNPGAGLLAVATLALGLGVSSALFGVVNGLLLKAPPIPDVDRVVTIHYGERPGTGPRTLAFPDYATIAASATGPFSSVAAVWAWDGVVNATGQGEEITGEVVTTGYFEVTRQRPQAGTLVLASGDRDATPSVVISDRLWRRWFDRRPSAIGQTVRIAGRPITVVGVAPPGFRGVLRPALVPADVWMPLGLVETLGRYRFPRFRFGWTDPRDASLKVIARLGDGITDGQVQSALAATPRANVRDESIQASPFATTPILHTTSVPQFDRAVTPLGIGFTALGVLVLLIACGNLASLLLARIIERRQELAIRLAAGASRLRLVRLVAVEVCLLTAGGLGAGLALGAALSRVLARLPPAFDGRTLQIDATLDWRVLAFGSALAVVAALLVGVGPAWRAGRTPEAALQAPRSRATPRRRRLHGLLAGGQILACTVLLVLAGLYVRSAVGALRHDPGFEITRTAMVRLHLNQSGYALGRDRAERLINRALAAARRLPGVERAFVVDEFPLGEVNDGVTLFAEGVAGAEGARITGKFVTVSPDFFAAMRMPIVLGRALRPSDDRTTTPVAVINERAARQWWPGQNPLGKRVAIMGAATGWREVVGVVADTDVGLPGSRGALLLRPVDQQEDYLARPAIVIETGASPETLVEPLRAVVRNLDPDVAVIESGTVGHVLSALTFPVRLAAGVTAALGTLALLLAMLGLYGLVAYAVRARTQELGIRLALGATVRQVQWLVMRQSALVLLSGLLTGLVVAYAGVTALRSVLQGAEPHDPAVFALVPLILVIVSAAATYLPSRRAARLDPAETLREG